ncbi:MAG: glyoxalase [Kofleriaceae bacterium]|nr:glyoxalase [Kofleriaceae bacterium]
MTVFVSDQDKALDFYTTVLGFENRVDNRSPHGRFVGVGLPGQDFLLVLCPGTPGRANAAAGQVPGAVVVETGDCRKVFADLKARGVEFETAAPLDLPFGRIVVGLDPDGNRLQIVERPKH